MHSEKGETRVGCLLGTDVASVPTTCHTAPAVLPDSRGSRNHKHGGVPANAGSFLLGRVRVLCR